MTLTRIRRLQLTDNMVAVLPYIAVMACYGANVKVPMGDRVERMHVYSAARKLRMCESIDATQATCKAPSHCSKATL